MALNSGSSAILWRSIVCVSVVWWMSNLFAVIASKSLMKGADTSDSPVGVTEALRDMRWLELTAAQHILGAIVATVWLKLKKTNVFTLPRNRFILIAAFANVIANTATNISFSVVSSAITQIVKAFEPIFTFFFFFVLGGKDGQALTCNILLSVAIMATGSCLFISSDATYNIWGIAAAVSCNMAFPVRNIFLKKSQQGTLEKYAVISVLSSGILLLLLPFKMLWVSLKEDTTDATFNISLSAVFHCSYNLASIEVLQMVSPLTHAVLNMCKRITIIVVNVIYFNHIISVQAFTGLISFCFGIVLYTMFTRLPRRPIKSEKKDIWSAAKCWSASFLSLLCLWNIYFMHFDLWSTNLQVVAKRSSHVEAKMKVMTSWVHDQAIPLSVLTNMNNLQNSNPFGIHVFCGTNVCLNNILEMNNPQVKGIFLRIHELFNETPLFEWQQKHVFHKILAGQSFEDHLQSATQLTLLWKFGGIYVSPKLSCSRLKNVAPGNISSWVALPLSTDKDFNVMDLVYFKDHHPFVWKLMKLFVEKYHTGLQKESFKFDFALLAQEQIMKHKDVGTRQNLPCNNSFLQVRKTKEHFGVFVVAKGNIGDEIQNFVGIQFYPYVDRLMKRELLKEDTGAGNTTAFMNAFYGGAEKEWPPPNNINPFLFSMHFEGLHNVSYMKSHSPIGTRDLATLRLLQFKGIDSYFSGCATLMLKNPSGRYNKNNSAVYIVDVKINQTLLPSHIQKHIKYHTHLYPWLKGEVSFFKKAYEIITKYSQAKAVITQRIHCALPCVAMGIPVVYINEKKLIGGSPTRTDGLLDLFHTIDKTKLSQSQFENAIRHFNWDNPPPNPNGGKVMRFRATFWKIIRQNSHLNNTAYRFGMVPYAVPDHPTQETEIFHLMYSASELNCSDTQKERCSLKWYQWRSLESILYHHPYDKVFLHSTHLQQSEFDVLTDVGYQVEVVDHMNIQHRNLRHDFKKAFQVDSEKVFKGGHKYLKTVFPLFLVYFWGGVFLKNDMIVLKSMKNISSNTFLLNNQDNGDIFFFLKFKQEYATLKTCFQHFLKESSAEKFQKMFMICAEKQGRDITLLPKENIHQPDKPAMNQKLSDSDTNSSFAFSYDTRKLEDEPTKKEQNSMFNTFCVLCDVKY